MWLQYELTPTKAIVAAHQVDEAVLADVSSYSAASETVRMARQSVSVVEWLEQPARSAAPTDSAMINKADFIGGSFRRFVGPLTG